ncbi:hypothetical protein HaLaN_26861 [Haematococcus lacustris]|uniref:Uncharacterized protein n=1 Tax=Haematococcus lacustris TaxID=44745 RepID=A0A6A0A7C5_HAELA|nr:hypothetical protein HaLaN_26861 [Haematococcus lacustris]
MFAGLRWCAPPTCRASLTDSQGRSLPVRRSKSYIKMMESMGCTCMKITNPMLGTPDVNPHIGSVFEQEL